MLDAHIFGHHLCRPFRGPQPLKASILDPLGNEPGLVISPKLNFPESPLIRLRIQVKGLENRPLHLLEIREIVQRQRMHRLLGGADEAGYEDSRPLARGPACCHSGSLKSDRLPGSSFVP